MIDIPVIPAGEINTFERTAAPLFRLAHEFFGNSTVFLDNQSISRFDLLYVHVHPLEGCLYHRTFRGDHYHLVVLVIIRRTNPPRVTSHESIAMTEYARHGISPVPIGTAPSQHAGQVDCLLDQRGNLLLGKPFFLEIMVKVLYLVVEEIAHLLEQSHRVGIVPRVLSRPD